MLKILICTTFTILLLSAGSATSADKPMAGSETSPTKDDLLGRIDLSVPETPAFVAIGVTPENVIRPGSSRELAISLLRGVDADGNLQAGLAIETSPYLLAMGKELSLREYKDNQNLRWLSRIKVSFATSSGQSDNDDAERTALAVRWTPWDEGDKRLDSGLGTCFDKNVSVENTLPPTQIGPGTQKGEVKTPTQIEAAAKDCIDKAEKRLWNTHSWDIGAAAFKVEDDTLSESGYSIWTSLALRLFENGQLILSARLHEDLIKGDSNNDGNLDLQDGQIISGRFRWGNKKAALLFEASYSDIEYTVSKQSDEYYDYMLGIEHKVSDGVWLQLAYGDRDGSDLPDNSESYLSGQIRWALSENSLR